MSEQPNMRLEILPDNEAQFGPCDCCGNMTRRVWGYVYSKDAARAAYYVEWTPGHQNNTTFDLIIGSWGDEAQSADRVSVAAEFKMLENGPAFRLIDADQRPYAQSSLVGKALGREALLEGEMRQQVFDILDLIYAEDPRLGILRTPA